MGLARHLFFWKRKWEDRLWTPRDSTLNGCSHSQQLAWELLLDSSSLAIAQIAESLVGATYYSCSPPDPLSKAGLAGTTIQDYR